MSGARRPGDPRADALRERFHALFPGAEVPVPVREIAEDLLGLHVEEEPLDVSGMLLPSHRLILLNADEPPERRRFTLGHEIGHWICHCAGAGRPARVLCRVAPAPAAIPNPVEREANVFAADLLMPAGAVRELAGAEAVEGLARRFEVSTPAMAWRLYNLGLVDTPPTEGGAGAGAGGESTLVERFGEAEPALGCRLDDQGADGTP